LGFEENGTLEYTELTVKLPEAKWRILIKFSAYIVWDFHD
jgi:hypothetical protein